MTILVIEDEFLVAAEIRFHLERGNLGEIEHAATEREAMAAIAARHWDAAVVDANLNGNGIHGIAAALWSKSIPFVIVTGYGRKGLSLPLDDIQVIDKPFDPQTLVEAVARLCTQGNG